MKKLLQFVTLIIVLILSGCSTSKVPKEFEDLIPANSNEYYIIGFEKQVSEADFFLKSIERFKKDKNVSGLTIYYKVNDSFLDEYHFHQENGFIILEKDKSPYYVESYQHFLDEK
ncbi:hypothetical protein ACEWK1_20960 [Metabacillus sp. YM-086]|uniref:hypothetical protein n=1 Tax=Metabacillus TaxID=2675233 RepID=UPI000EF594B6|nr:hypothetical protein [Metabacillus litoralis]